MLHEELTGKILAASFDLMNELGAGFLESVYEKALAIALTERGLSIKGIPVGLLINFGNPRLEFRRLSREKSSDEMEAAQISRRNP